MNRYGALASTVGLSLLVVAALTACGDSGGGTRTVAIEGTIVFSGPGSSTASDIYLLDSQGTHRLAGGGHITQAYPVWSPDGTQIAFITETLQLALINRDGSGGVLLTPKSDNPSLWAWQPAWLPDGTISVVSGGRLAVLRTDGSGVRVLTPSNPKSNPKTVKGIRSGYAWSPDGTKVVFDCGFIAFPTEVCLFDVASGASRTLLDTREAGEFHAFAWSPDGTMILAGAGSGGSIDSGKQAEDLYSFDTNGQGLHAFARPGKESNPAWSPDGSKILFDAYTDNPDSDTGSSYDMWVMNADGSGAQKLSSDPKGREPNWTG